MYLTSGRAELLGETDTDQAFDPSPPDSQSLRDQDLPRKNLRTHFSAPCLVAFLGEDDLMSSQHSGVAGCEEREEDEIEEFEEEW